MLEEGLYGFVQIILIWPNFSELCKLAYGQTSGLYFSVIMSGFTNLVCMSDRMLYLLCVKI